MGSAPGNLETWLLLRSLRTLSIRVKRQSKTAGKVGVSKERVCPFFTKLVN